MSLYARDVFTLRDRSLRPAGGRLSVFFFINFVIKLLNVDLWGLKQSCHTVFCVASQALMRCVHRGCRMLDVSQVSCRLIRDVLSRKNKKQILYL